MKSGDIIAVPLDRYGLDPICCKYVNICRIWPQSDYQDMLYIFNVFVGDLSFKYGVLERNELLMNPLVVSRVHFAVKNLGWKIIGFQPLNDFERILPNVKMGLPVTATCIEEVKRWCVLKNAGDASEYFSATEEDVSTLNHAGAINAEYVPFRIAFEIFRRSGRDIATEYELDLIEQDIYWKASSTKPILKPD